MEMVGNQTGVQVGLPPVYSPESAAIMAVASVLGAAIPFIIILYAPSVRAIARAWRATRFRRTPRIDPRRRSTDAPAACDAARKA